MEFDFYDSSVEERRLSQEEEFSQVAQESAEEDSAQPGPASVDHADDEFPARQSAVNSALGTVQLVGGLLAVAAILALPRLGLARIRGFGQRKKANSGGVRIGMVTASDSLPLVDDTSTFAALREAIFGQSKRQIASVLGPPPVSGQGEEASPAFWQANLWYYPFNRHHHSAIALHFSHDRLARIDYIPAV